MAIAVDTRPFGDRATKSLRKRLAVKYPVTLKLAFKLHSLAESMQTELQYLTQGRLSRTVGYPCCGTAAVIEYRY